MPENRQMMPELPETTAEKMEFMKVSPKLAWCIITKFVILYQPVELYYHILGILYVIVLHHSTNVFFFNTFNYTRFTDHDVLTTAFPGFSGERMRY